MSRRKTSLANELGDLLASGRGEREALHPFLKKFPAVLQAALKQHEERIVRGISEFRFGSELRADFVLLVSFSGGFWVNMIELEPSTEKILNRDGSLHGRFNKSLAQIYRWKEYERHPAKMHALGCDLERQFCEKEILWRYRPGEPPFDHTGKYPLSHPDCSLAFTYHIVIGRRASRTREELARIQTFRNELIEIVSWDRLLEAAHKFTPTGRKRSVQAYYSERERLLLKPLQKLLARESRRLADSKS